MNTLQNELNVLAHKKTLFVLILFVMAIAWVFCNGPDDGGWYLQASLKATRGEIPYSDYMFPQGPLMVYIFTPSTLFSNSVLAGRLLAMLFGLIGLSAIGLSVYKLNKEALPIFLIGLICFPFGISYITLIKTHAPTLLFIGLGVYAWVCGKDFWASLCFAVASTLRLSMLPMYGLFLLWGLYKKKYSVMLSILIAVAWFSIWYNISGGQIIKQMYLPFGFIKVNELSEVCGALKGNITSHEIVMRKFQTISRCLLAFPFLIFVFLLPSKARFRKEPIIASVLLIIANISAERPYDEYQLIPLYLLLFAASIRVDLTAKWKLKNSTKLLLLLTIIIPWFRVVSWANRSDYQPYLSRLNKQTEWLNENLPKGNFYPLDAYLSLNVKRPMTNSAWLGQFSYLPHATDQFVAKFKLNNENTLRKQLIQEDFKSIYTPDLTMGKDSLLRIMNKYPDWKKLTVLPKYFPKSGIIWTKN